MFSKLFPKSSFTNFPNGIGGTPDTKQVVDILRRVKFVDTFGNLKGYKEYVVQYGETPDIVATKLYGSSEWYWLIMLFNDMTDPFRDWPRSGLDQDIDNKSYEVDVVSYLPVNGSSLYPFNVGDTVVRVKNDLSIDEENPFTSTIVDTRKIFFAIDIDIINSSGVRLQEGDLFGVINTDNELVNIHEAKLVRTPDTTISGFETEDGRALSPFTSRSSIDTPDEKILDPSTGSTNLTTTLLYKYIQFPNNDAYSIYFRSVKYSQEYRTDLKRNIKVFPNELKEQAYKEAAKLLSQLPSVGINSRITSSPGANRSRLTI